YPASASVSSRIERNERLAIVFILQTGWVNDKSRCALSVKRSNPMPALLPFPLCATCPPSASKQFWTPPLMLLCYQICFCVRILSKGKIQ
ncbi:MAG: hypothetical protein LBT89_09920, partial [Planctomycetaceae bacterium]|nr:hypothetical protein [Planctomycetaceae bacterium]